MAATAQPPAWLVDEFIESWVSWCEARDEVRSAYESWATCPEPERRRNFEIYHAALDREEDAARIHSRFTYGIQTAAGLRIHGANHG